jgi:hypothetical protein
MCSCGGATPARITWSPRLASAPTCGALHPITSWRGRDGDSAPVFDGAWVDARTIRYRSGCCDPPIDLQFTVP